MLRPSRALNLVALLVLWGACAINLNGSSEGRPCVSPTDCAPELVCTGQICVRSVPDDAGLDAGMAADGGLASDAGSGPVVGADGGINLSAQLPLFGDDFETGTLLTTDSPVGRWDQDFTTAGCTLAPSDAGAHRGTYGLVVSVTMPTVHSGNCTDVVHSIGPASTVYARYWVRLQTDGGSGDAISSTENASPPFTRATLDIHLLFSGSIQVEGYHADGGYTGAASIPLVTPAAWHLIETLVEGVGGASGTRAAWLDGQPAGSALTGVDWTGLSVFQDKLGATYLDNAVATGSIDFDDFRSGYFPHASHFALSGDGGLTHAVCAPMSVLLEDSVSGTLAPAPYDFSATVAVTGTGKFFADSACSNPISAVSFNRGNANAAAFFFAPDAGTDVLTVSFLDFLPTNMGITVQ